MTWADAFYRKGDVEYRKTVRLVLDLCLRIRAPATLSLNELRCPTMHLNRSSMQRKRSASPMN